MLTGLRLRVRRPVAALGLIATGLVAVGGVGAVGAAPAAVVIQHYAFAPGQLTVAVGDTVTWTNRDAVGHDVTSIGAGPLASGRLAAGQAYSATFASAGTFRYTCTIHPDMVGVVTVKALATTTTAAVATGASPTTAPAAAAATATNVAAAVGPVGAAGVGLTSDSGPARINPLLFIAAVVVAVVVGATIAVVAPGRRRSEDA